MAVSLGDPQERLADLTADVRRLEYAYTSDFKQWKKLGFPSAVHYFQTSYSDAIDTLARISEEERKEDAKKEIQPHLKALFRQTVRLLSRSAHYIHKVKAAISPVHKLLLSDMLRLNQRPDINGVNGLLTHLVKMTGRLADTCPPAREAWTEDGRDLKPDEEFDAIFQQFRDLDQRIQRKTQGSSELYARQSYELLIDACRALHIPEIQADPGEDFFNNETRPTYVDYPHRTREFLYGRGQRPGILTLKSNLGGPLREKQLRGINNAKKRGAEPAEPAAQAATKKARKESGYTMTIVNATADLEDVLRDSQFWTPKDEDIARPGHERLVTPTCENRKQLLSAYREELIAIANALYKRKFNAPLNRATLPSTAEDRAAWLRTASNEIRTARASVNRYIDDAFSPAKAKQLRLEAYRLKLARAIYMVGLLSGTPEASPDEIRTALRDRLDDWVLHERAWSTGDQYLLARTGLTKETWEILQASIRQRDANINQWRTMRAELGKNVEGDEKNGDNKDADIVNNAQQEEHQEKQQEPQEEEAAPEKQKGGPVLTQKQIENANKILRRVLDPTLPSRGDFELDTREEGRRHAYFDKIVAAKLRGQPIPQWGYKKKVVDPFAAGGPPGWEELATETYWERLKYMWILTYWRLYQLKEFDP